MSGGTAGGGGGVRGTGAECRKFAPNIFNKSKCSSCFKQKEEHSAEALECNRATRKISKCGYLFVAPGWDFSNPLNRTKFDRPFESGDEERKKTRKSQERRKSLRNRTVDSSPR